MVGMNEVLGLPRQDRMSKVAICFDVDGTIIDHMGNERERYIKMLIAFHNAFKNAKIVVWSGGGKQYAEAMGFRLGIDSYVWKYMSKMSHQELRDAGYLILAVDDIQDTLLGDVNLIVRQ